ncbi:MAG: ATP-binding protein [Armatimonadota bacterium]
MTRASDFRGATVTFLFTDIEGSTRLLHDLGDEEYAKVLAVHHRILHESIAGAGGLILQDHGDGLLAMFDRAADGVQAAVSAQRALAAHRLREKAEVRVRMGLHTGEPVIADGGYVGLDVHRAARICQAAWGGQILTSQTTRDLLGDTRLAGLAFHDLGEHRLKDLARSQRLFQVVAADLPAQFPRPRSLDALPNNLPVQLTSFVGRDREENEVRHLLQSAHALTLTGAGGSGKTRLALQVAAEILEEFPDGVWLVELAPLADPELVVQTVASTLGVQEIPRRDLMGTLGDALKSRKLLLLLDNAEHLLAACAVLARTLTRACPGLRLLVTSREALGIAGEQIYRVRPLAVPDLSNLPSVASLMEHDAVRLFVERARAVVSDFVLVEHNARAVAEVCNRLDGIPLALELAAARVKALSPEQIARRLDDRFRLLTGGARLDVPHHQTLQAAVGWSYDLLSDPERLLFQRLAVFAAGFTLEAAEAVGAGEGVESRDVLDLVARLADKSLVVVEEHEGEARYRMLETIREYATNRLRASDEADRVRTRHLEFFESAARDVYNFTEAQRRQWLNRLEVEHDNLRAALQWSRETGELAPSAAQTGLAQTGLRLAISMARFWEILGFLREGREHLEALLKLPANGSPSAERATALNWLGRLAFFQNDYAPARAACEEAASLFRTLGDRFGLARTLRNLGPIALSEGAYARARALYEEDLRLSREREDEHEIAMAMTNIGLAARCQGEYDLARTVLEESLERFDRLGISKAYPLIHLGVVHYCQGDFAEASRILKAGLTLFAANKNRRLVAESFVYLAGVAAAVGHPRRAATLCGAAETLYGEVGAVVWPVNRAIYDRALEEARQRLGERGYEEAWADGREMTMEQGIAYALGEDGSPNLGTEEPKRPREVNR